MLFHPVMWGEDKSLEGMEDAGQKGILDFKQRLEELSGTGDSLEKLAAMVDFEIFPAHFS